MPTYDTATAAFAVGTTRKWVDNLSSHFELTGVAAGTRGRNREFSFDAVVMLRTIRVLADELGLPVRRAVEIAEAACESPGGDVALAGSVQLSVDVERHRREVRQRLLEAAESVPRIRRGRPPADPG